jgi:hypothetical protein
MATPPNPHRTKITIALTGAFFQKRNNPYFLLTTPFGDLKGYKNRLSPSA